MVVREPVGIQGPATVQEIRQQVNLIQEVMREVMQVDQHYGVIPGSAKPSLFQPGAQKLMLTFRLRAIIDPDRDIKVVELGNGHCEVRSFVHICNSAGEELATGVGSCSTMEAKYRYRGGVKLPLDPPVKVPTDYWNKRNAGAPREELVALLGGPGRAPAKIDGQWLVCEVGEKMENPDIADVRNTVLKMSVKRATIHGVLAATAASDIFTQDIEDLPVEMVGHQQKQPEPVKQPERTSEAKPPQQEQPAQQEAPKPTPPVEVEQENGEGGVVKVTVESVIAGKSGTTKAGKPWQSYRIVAGGNNYSTFSKNVADRADEYRTAGKLASLTYKMEKGYRTIVELVSVAEQHSETGTMNAQREPGDDDSIPF